MAHIKRIGDYDPVMEGARHPMTVKELYDALGKIIRSGGGGKTIYMATDDEGNDYRKMWYAPMTDPKQIESFMEISCSGLSNCDDVNNAVVLG